MKYEMKYGAKENAMIIAGSFLMAFAVGNVLEPMQFVTGGVTGLAIVIKEYTKSLLPGINEGIPIWFTNLLVNVPLFILAFVLRGKKFVAQTMLGMIFLTVFLGIIPTFEIIPKDAVLNTIFGGALNGLGIGLVLRARGSTGGTDLIAVLINPYVSSISVSKILAYIDGVVVAIGIFTFGLEKGLYALLTIVISARVSDWLVEGFPASMVTYIITKKPEEITKRIFEQLERGITSIHVKGVYENSDRTMLLCVTNKKQVPAIKQIVKDFDADSFVLIAEVRETFGEGFRKYR